MCQVQSPPGSEATVAGRQCAVVRAGVDYSALGDPLTCRLGRGPGPIQGGRSSGARGQGSRMQVISLPRGDSRERRREVWGRCNREGPGEEALTFQVVTHRQWQEV